MNNTVKVIIGRFFYKINNSKLDNPLKLKHQIWLAYCRIVSKHLGIDQNTTPVCHIIYADTDIIDGKLTVIIEFTKP